MAVCTRATLQLPCCLKLVLLALLAVRMVWAAPSLTTQAPSSAPADSPTSGPSASTVRLTVNTTTITNRTPVQLNISGVNAPTAAGESLPYLDLGCNVSLDA